MTGRARRLLSGVVATLAVAVSQIADQTWQLDPAMAPEIVFDDHSGALTNLIVRPFPDGRVLLSGRFNHVDGVAVRALARLNRDLTFDRSFNAEYAPGENFVSAAPLADGRVLMVVETSRFNCAIVRLLADGRRDTTFAPLAISDRAALAPLPGGAILARGDFTLRGSTNYSGLVRFDATGALDPTFRARISIGTFSSALPGPNGSLVVSYNLSATFSPRTLVRLRPDGSLDPTFTPTITSDHYVQAVQPDGAVVTLANNRLARFLPHGTLDPNYAQDRRLALVGSISALPDGRVVVQAQEAGRNYHGSNGPIYLLTVDGAIERELRHDAERGEFQSIIATLPDQRLLLAHGLRVATVSGQNTFYGFGDTKPVLASIDGRPTEPLPARLAVRPRCSLRSQPTFGV